MKNDDMKSSRIMTGTKGSLWHWLSLSIIVVALIFFWAGRQDLPFIEKGKWQLDFLQQAVLPAEQEDLRVHLLARDAGKDAALALTANGGVTTGSVSDCGVYNGDNLWNRNDGLSQDCFPNAERLKQALNDEMGSRLQDALPEHEFSDFGFDDRNVYGVGERKTITTETATYTYDDSFSIDVGYLFSEQVQVAEQAANLVGTCTGDSWISKCVIDTMYPNWHHGQDCASPVPVPQEGPMQFCVQSSYIINGQRVEYHFALDFGPLAAALPVT